ncbi:MAG: AMP-binding protein [Alphaproteobacteria bacterium]|jgi:acyl-CoA synthetase (AMP-forming)/AMP-acid ligase II|nr:AMP-binding protein [Alphaproteobacteria bacterium]
MRIIDFFDRGAALAPERAFLVDDEESRTYAQSHELSQGIAQALQALGLGDGTKVAVYSPNAARAFECIIGLARAGAVWVPVNARNAIDDNCYILNNTEAEVLFYHSSFAENVARMREQCPALATFVCIDRVDGDVPALADWIVEPPGELADWPDDPHRLAMIIGSGGTTGAPKGVMLSSLNLETMIATMNLCMPSPEPPVHLVVAPMTHAAGVMALTLMGLGASNVILKEFDALAVMQAIERHRVSHLFLPPTAVYVMLAHPRVREFDYSSLKYFIYAAAPMSVDKLKQAIEIFGPIMTQTFGQAEAPMICTYFSPAEHTEALAGNQAGRLASCGRPTLLTPTEIMDEEGNILGPGQPGEIVVRGNMVMLGYYRNAEETAKVSKFGWHHTGDIGQKDEDGYIYIVDRLKDMIISGGFNVYPSEIERVIWGHAAVQDCAVVGVPDEKWGEAVKAVIELKPGASVAVEEIIALCKEKLGSVKAPKSVDFIETLPRSPVGKVLKRDIRQRYWQGQDRQVG